MATRKPTRKKDDVRNDIETLSIKIDAFIDQYEIDMRGDKKVDNGSGGVVGTIRELKETFRDYPSLTYLLAKKPIRTLSIGVGVWLIIAILYDFGLLRIIGKIFGAEIP